MSDDFPLFSVRPVNGGYVIDAIWPSGEIECLIDIYSSPKDAQHWVNEHSDDWVNHRLQIKISNIIQLPIKRLTATSSDPAPCGQHQGEADDGSGG